MRLPLRIVRPWEPFGITFVGDPHLESPNHDGKLFEHDMNAAAQRGDSIVLLGDINDWILPQDTKRRSARHQQEAESAITAILGRTVKVLEPWANSIDVIMLGNHETAVMKYHSIDPVSLLVYELNKTKTRGAFEDGKVHSGGYTCWLQVQFVSRRNNKRTMSTSQKILLHHGRGGGAPVTKGMIDGNRLKVGNVFDLCVVGHKHTQIHDTDRFHYMDDYGNMRTKYRDFFLVGGYNGSDVQQNPDLVDEDTIYPRGMDIDYSDTFYNTASQGAVRVVFEPRTTSDDPPWVKRTIVTESQAFAP